MEDNEKYVQLQVTGNYHRIGQSADDVSLLVLCVLLVEHPPVIAAQSLSLS